MLDRDLDLDWRCADASAHNVSSKGLPSDPVCRRTDEHECWSPYYARLGCFEIGATQRLRLSGCPLAPPVSTSLRFESGQLITSWPRLAQPSALYQKLRSSGPPRELLPIPALDLLFSMQRFPLVLMQGSLHLARANGIETSGQGNQMLNRPDLRSRERDPTYWCVRKPPGQDHEGEEKTLNKGWSERSSQLPFSVTVVSQRTFRPAFVLFLFSCAFLLYSPKRESKVIRRLIYPRDVEESICLPPPLRHASRVKAASP